MERLELLAPAGSFEALTAAVQNRADAVYMGFGDFNARRGAKNFSEEEMRQAVEYCRLRGVKTHITLNTLLTDRELSRAEKIVRQINRIGADAVIVADWGVARMIRQIAPELPIHASTQATIHSLEGVEYAAEHGFSRVVLSRELSREQIAHICKHSPVEIEVFAHGALCMCYSGQCYLSSVIGGRSGNRGMCAQPCRLPYQFNSRSGEAYPLSLKDNCMAEHLKDLKSIGVTSIKLEGRMKRPEYVAIVTDIYAKLLREQRAPTREELQLLERVFSRQGFTDGYYRGITGPEMFGIRGKDREEDAIQRLYKRARESYSKDAQRLDVTFYCVIKKGEPAILAAQDDIGNRYIAKGPIPEAARTRATDEKTVKDQLQKTGGTQFRCAEANVMVDEGCVVPVSVLNAMRRECLEHFTNIRVAAPVRKEGEFREGFHFSNPKKQTCVTVSLMQFDQLCEELCALEPGLICVPLMEAAENPEKLKQYAKKANLAVTLPRIIQDRERDAVCAALAVAKTCGIEQAMIGNVGQFALANKAGMQVRCDFGLNVFNSQTLRELKQDGAISAVLSPELTFAQIRDLHKSIDTELIVYGRLPVMVMENCVVKNHANQCLCKTTTHLSDRTGMMFPLVREYPHRNILLNSQKLFWADKAKEYQGLGLWGARLYFTTEHPRECVQITKRYMGKDNTYMPTGYTRGLYRRGVE